MVAIRGGAREVRRAGNDNTIASSVICWATVVLSHSITLLGEQNKQKGPGDPPDLFFIDRSLDQ
jgi:hypothetical protein